MTTTRPMNLYDAKMYVAHHSDDDGQLDDTDLRNCFRAIYDRDPDAQDEREGLWSLCCVGVSEPTNG